MPSNDPVAKKLIDLAESVTKRWAKQRRAETRYVRAILNRRSALSRRRRPKTLKEAAWDALPAAYATASDNGRLPANPRQIYYAARPTILEMTGKETLSGQYFSQTLLVDYIEETGVDWDIVWDNRGHFREPHTKREIGLGTLAVRGYLRSRRGPKIVPATIAAATVETSGPRGRYGAALFLEKEGFAPILEAAAIAERFDIAILSTKGMSVTAARQLVDALAGDGVRLFVLHDFDVAGFSIRKTLTESGRRYRFRNKLDFVDLGLRLGDVERLDLESEPVNVDKNEDSLRARLEINGATEEEIAFLLSGQRVELNAMPSDIFVQFVEVGLREHGVEKVVPDASLLVEAYAAFRRGEAAAEALEDELGRLNEEAVETPADLMDRVKQRLADIPAESWIDALAAVAEEDET